MYVCGAIFLALAIIVPVTSQSEEVDSIDRRTYEFSFSKLVSGTSYQIIAPFLGEDVQMNAEGTSDYAVLYVMTSNTCASCRNEVVAFSDLVSRRGFMGTSVEQYAFILDKEPDRVRRFGSLARLPIPAFVGTDNDYDSELRLFHESEELRQVIFLDRKSDRIVMRARIEPGIVTPEEDKIRIIKAAESLVSGANL